MPSVSCPLAAPCSGARAGCAGIGAPAGRPGSPGCRAGPMPRAPAPGRAAEGSRALPPADLRRWGPHGGRPPAGGPAGDARPGPLPASGRAPALLAAGSPGAPVALAVPGGGAGLPMPRVALCVEAAAPPPPSGPRGGLQAGSAASASGVGDGLGPLCPPDGSRPTGPPASSSDGRRVGAAATCGEGPGTHLLRCFRDPGSSAPSAAAPGFGGQLPAFGGSPAPGLRGRSPAPSVRTACHWWAAASAAQAAGGPGCGPVTAAVRSAPGFACRPGCPSRSATVSAR